MNAFLLILPFLLVRFGLLAVLDKEAIKRAAYFPPLFGREIVAYGFYQVANAFLLLYPLLLTIRTEGILFYAGLPVYLLGLLLCAGAMMSFARPETTGFSRKGLYRFSRNPVYIGYFFFFSGCVLLTHSRLLLVALLVFQYTAHWIIRSEERWCLDTFGEEYREYQSRVRRYI